MSIRHFPRRSSPSYFIFVKQAEDYNHWWTMFKLIFVFNKNAGPDMEKRVGEYAISVSTLRRRKNGKLSSGFGLGFRVARDSGEDDLLISLYFGKLFSIWIHLNGPWLRKICKVRSKKYEKFNWEGRVYSFDLFGGGGSWFRFEWGTLPHHWGKDTPGIEWSSSNLARKIYGYKRSVRETIQENIQVAIELPEGVYEGICKEERSRWFYTKPVGKLLNKIHEPRWKTYWYIDIPGGIPVEGKGENSYDCGMDGLFGLGGGSNSNPLTLADSVVQHVLKDRNEYGGPFDLPTIMTVSEAEEWQKAKNT